MIWWILFLCVSFLIWVINTIAATCLEYLTTKNDKYHTFKLGDVIFASFLSLIPIINIYITFAIAVEMFRNFFGLTLSDMITSKIKGKNSD